MHRAARWILGVGAVVVSQPLPAQQQIPPDKLRIADAVRADLSKLSDLERSYFVSNKRFTTDIASLHFSAASGALIAISYASARTFSASASDVRLAPFLCFVIASSTDAGSPAEKPFCTDSRYGKAATALASAGPADEKTAARGSTAPAQSSVRRVSVADDKPGAPKPVEPPAAPIVLTPGMFAERLRAATGARNDSIVVTVQFAVNDARYDPSRGVLEIAVERVPLPLFEAETTGTASARPAFACFTRPAFVCGTSGLTFIARDLFHVAASKAPDAALLHAGLNLQARFAVGRRDDSTDPALTLLALVLQSNREVLSRWESVAIR